MIEPLLLEEYNAGIDRAKTAYWHATSPIAARERAIKKAIGGAAKAKRYRERKAAKLDGRAA